MGLRHNAGSRPDFVGAIYGPRLGEFTLPTDAPALSVCVAEDDSIAVEGSTYLYRKWKAAGRPTEIQTYPTGGHGFGMGQRGLQVDDWVERFRDWLDANGFRMAASKVARRRRP